jgi:hypothetical protein
MLAATIVVLAFVSFACLPVPLGDPARSTADSQLFGVWEWRDAHVNRAVIRPWDQRTYVIDVLAGDFTGARGDTIAPKSRSLFKGWLTTVKGQTFLTMQFIETIGTVNGDPRPPTYMVMRVKIQGTQLTATPLDPQFKPVADAKTPADLERAVSANHDNPKLFATPTVATRWTAEQMKALDTLQDTFREWKAPQP